MNIIPKDDEDEKDQPPNSTVATRNAEAWRKPGGGYDQWKAGDAQREKDLPIGGIAPLRPKPDMEPRKPLPSLGSRIGAKKLGNPLQTPAEDRQELRNMRKYRDSEEQKHPTQHPARSRSI